MHSSAFQGLRCSACRKIVKSLAQDIRFLLQTDSYWTTTVVDQRLRLSCSDPELPGKDIRQVCVAVLNEHFRELQKQVIAHTYPGNDDYETDLSHVELCRDKLKLCGEGELDVWEVMANRRRDEL
eukprot:GHVS01066825.1.p1 GENE.GHVS01066825.1~~GHVS01066825.1.p1  ORF type:complete len:143 (+),score=9.87 GHVS01066825.1:56-430(+)